MHGKHVHVGSQQLPAQRSKDTSNPSLSLFRERSKYRWTGEDYLRQQQHGKEMALSVEIEAEAQ
jgi:hypothetical protein